MATGWIEKRHQKSFTIIIDEGFDIGTGKRKRWSTSVKCGPDPEDDSEAKRILQVILGEIAAGTRQKTAKISVKDYFSDWFSTPEARKLGITTLRRYKGCVFLRIIPWMGHLTLENLLDCRIIVAFFDRMINEGRLNAAKRQGSNKSDHEPISAASLLYHLSAFRTILNRAVCVDRILPYNPASNLTIPLPEDEDDEFDDDSEIKVFTFKEIAALEEKATEHSYFPIVATALRTGMRRGELLGLKWQDINFTKSTLYIRRALIYFPDIGFRLKKTKSKKKREIAVTKELMDILKKLKAKQPPEQKFVFTEPDGTLIKPDTLSSWFPDFCEDNGITRLNFHCTRHTHASQLLEAREDINWVAARLGHSSPLVTYSTYLHFIPEDIRESLKEYEKRIKRHKKKPIAK